MKAIYDRIHALVFPFLKSHAEDLTKHDREILESYDGKFIHCSRDNGTHLVKLHDTAEEYIGKDEELLALMRMGNITQPGIMEIRKWVTGSRVFIDADCNTVFYYYDGNTLSRQLNKEQALEVFDQHTAKVMEIHDLKAEIQRLKTALLASSMPINPLPFLICLTKGVQKFGTDWIRTEEAQAILYNVIAQAYSYGWPGSMMDEWVRLRAAITEWSRPARATDKFDITKDDPTCGWYPSEGWAVFIVDNDKVCEVQKIDELGILDSDSQAIELAWGKGYKVGTPNNPLEVTNADQIHKAAPTSLNGMQRAGQG